MTLLNTDSEFEFMYYIRMTDAYYEEYGRMTEIQIDTLVILYRITHNEMVFNRIFQFHYKLLNILVYQKFRKFKKRLNEEDLNDLTCMAYGEFYRRVMYYAIPQIAPFSKYIKLYLRQWLNEYAGAMADRNKRRSKIDDDLCAYAENMLYQKVYYINFWEDDRC